MQMLSIRQINNPNDPCLPHLCQWLMDWWGKEEGFTKEKMASYVGHSLCAERIPQTFVLYLDDTPIGMYQFSMTDIDVRPDIYPWLINVYIEPRHRGKGYFHTMMASVKKQAAALGLKALYLFTRHESLYERYGFVLEETFPTFLKDGDVQRLYRLSLEE